MTSTGPFSRVRGTTRTRSTGSCSASHLLLPVRRSPSVQERSCSSPSNARLQISAIQCQEEVAMHSYQHIIPVTLVKYSCAR